jgi:hypothetical protein
MNDTDMRAVVFGLLAVTILVLPLGLSWLFLRRLSVIAIVVTALLGLLYALVFALFFVALKDFSPMM